MTFQAESNRFVVPPNTTSTRTVILPPPPPMIELSAEPLIDIVSPDTQSIPVPPPLPKQNTALSSVPVAEPLMAAPLVPEWPQGLLWWWFSIQMAAVKDAALLFLDEQQSCSTLALIVKPWVQSWLTVSQQIQLVEQQHQQLLTELGRLTGSLKSQQAMLVNAIKTVLSEVKTTVVQHSQQISLIVKKLVADQQSLFQSLLHSLHWQRQAVEQQRLQVLQQKSQLHQSLPPTDDPLDEARRKAACADSIQAVQERYFLFLQQLTQDCAKQTLKALQLSLKATQSPVLQLQVLYNSLRSVEACVPPPRTEILQFRSEIQELLKRCNQKAATAAIELVTLKQAHDMIDNVADKVLQLLKDEKVDNINKLSIATLQEMKTLFEVAMTQICQQEQVFDATVLGLLDTLQQTNQILVNYDKTLFVSLAETTQTVSALTQLNYKTYMSYSQMGYLFTQANDYCQKLKTAIDLLA